MTTYSKLFCCIGRSASDKNIKTKNESPLSKSLVKNKSKKEDDSFIDSYPDIETLPSFDDANIDALGMLEERLQYLQVNYMRKLIFWRNQKMKVMADNALQEEIDAQHHSFRKETLVKILQELKSLFQTADAHLHDIYQRAAPAISLVEDDLCKNFDELDKLPPGSKDPEVAKQDAKLRLDVCNNSIKMLTAYTSVINDVSREIKMCVKLEEILEKTVCFVLDVIMLVFTPTSFPKFNFNFSFSGLYRNYLFSEVQPEVARIENLVRGSEASVTKGKNVLTESRDATSQQVPTANATPELSLVKPTQTGNELCVENANKLSVATSCLPNDVPVAATLSM